MAKKKQVHAIVAEFARVRASKRKDGSESVKLAPTNGTTDDGNGFEFEVDGRTVRVFPLAYIEGTDAQGIELEIEVKGVSFGNKSKSKSGSAPTGLAALSPEQLAALSPEQIAAFNS